ncbi:MAG TPA: hypothetical protein VGI92_03805 [Gemmatimonadales bacterium]|jgi:hypothetical protein
MVRRVLRVSHLLLVAIALRAAPLAAQIEWGAQATPLATMAAPAPGGSNRTEFRVVAPTLFGMLPLLHGHLTVHVMLDGEGLTMSGGELSLGAWGESYEDRRHPHTWAHEVLVTVNDPVRLPAGVRWSLTAGKGFAAFGTEDPMSRPAMIYPVNHHFSQVLERAVVVGAVSWRAVTVEGSVFNGDEPERWNEWPNWSRFGDSWSARLTVRPTPGLEIGGSIAEVKSPEHRQGAGLVHRLVNFSARYQRLTHIGEVYALAEWDKTVEGGFFSYYSGLAEVQWRRYQTGLRAYLRFERTDRPEELRLSSDDFRTIRPHSENGNIGITRWNVATLGAGKPFSIARLPVRFETIGEAAYMHVTTLTGVFDPVQWYGRNDLWMLSVGLRIGAGSPMHRMGQYGAAMAGPMHSMNEMKME